VAYAGDQGSNRLRPYSNECENNYQCSTPPEYAAVFYHDAVIPLMATADPNAQLIVGGVNANPCGILWLTQFVTYYRQRYGELGNAGWHFHLYPEIAPGDWPDPDQPERAYNVWDNDPAPPPPNATPVTPNPTPVAFWEWRPERLNYYTWRTDAAGSLGFIWLYGDPDQDEIWFTEIGCLLPEDVPGANISCPAAGFIDGYVSDFTGWLNSDEGRWVDRYAWFTDIGEPNWFVDLYDVSGLYQPGNYWALGTFYSQVSRQVAPSIALPVPSAFVYLPLVGYNFSND
jgi:hypothetical protein